MGEVTDGYVGGDPVMFRQVEVGEQLVYVSIHELGASAGAAGDEWEIGVRRPSLEQAFRGAAALAKSVIGTFQETGAEKVTVEFGCDVGVEGGSFVALVGKVSAKSTFKVGLEWCREAP